MSRLPLLSALLLLVCSTAAPAAEPFKPPEDLLEGWYTRIETSKGRIVARLLPEQAPNAVAHFAALAEGRLEWADPVTGKLRQGRYYDGAEVYRSEAAFYFQIGDRTPVGGMAPFMYVGLGEPGQVNFNLPYRLGMVKVGPKISAARIMITAGALPQLTNTIPCFGAVVTGQQTIFDISAVKTHRDGRPIDPVTIELVEIFSVGEPNPLPEPVHYFPKPVELKGVELNRLKPREP